MSDDNVEYMTGEELRFTFNKIASRRSTTLSEDWDRLAAELRIPKPPPPKTMGQVLFERELDLDWKKVATDQQRNWEREAAKLRDDLNAAFDATKGAG